MACRCAPPDLRARWRPSAAWGRKPPPVVIRSTHQHPLHRRRRLAGWSDHRHRTPEGVGLPRNRPGTTSSPPELFAQVLRRTVISFSSRVVGRSPRSACSRDRDALFQSRGAQNAWSAVPQFFEFEDVELDSPTALTAADRSSGTGARGLGPSSKVLLNTMYDLPGGSDIVRCVIDATRCGQGQPTPCLAPFGSAAEAVRIEAPPATSSPPADGHRARCRTGEHSNDDTAASVALTRHRATRGLIGDPQRAAPAITSRRTAGSTAQILTASWRQGLTVASQPHLDRVNDR